jgi:hypothetical protein
MSGYLSGIGVLVLVGFGFAMWVIILEKKKNRSEEDEERQPTGMGDCITDPDYIPIDEWLSTGRGYDPMSTSGELANASVIVEDGPETSQRDQIDHEIF